MEYSFVLKLFVIILHVCRIEDIFWGSIFFQFSPLTLGSDQVISLVGQALLPAGHSCWPDIDVLLLIKSLWFSFSLCCSINFGRCMTHVFCYNPECFHCVYTFLTPTCGSQGSFCSYHKLVLPSQNSILGVWLEPYIMSSFQIGFSHLVHGRLLPFLFWLATLFLLAADNIPLSGYSRSRSIFISRMRAVALYLL